MNTTLIILLAGVALFGLFIIFVFRFVHKKNALNKDFYREKWADIEAASTQEVSWISAVVGADKLLDDALKKRNYRGKTMGERMVSASRAFTDTDRTWAAHKLRNRLVHETSIKIRQKHVDSAMSAFKKALKDVGAL